MAVRDDSKDRPVSTFLPSDAARLLAFNVTTTRIVDLCNADVTAYAFDEDRHYTTYQRALKGKSSWEEIVQTLEGLMEMQTMHPRRYLPADDPPDVERLAAWMKQVATAPWWYEVLKLEVPLGSFKAWYSGAPMGKDKTAAVKARVDEWWGRVMQACARAELGSLGRSLYQASKGGRVSADTADSHFYTLVVEDGLPVEDARKLYQDMMVAAFESHCSLIDLTDPKDPLELHKSRFPGDQWGHEFDKMVADGFPLAIPRAAPAFDEGAYFEDGRWGDRRSEECQHDLNAHLYRLHYRERCQRYWDARIRSVRVRREIVEVSQDGVTWRAASDKEKAGWDNGGHYIAKYRHENEGREAVNQYLQAVNAHRDKVRRLRQQIELCRVDEERDRLEKILRDTGEALRIAQADF